MFGIRLRVGGKYACFTRPEMKVERVSYDVMTPSAARGILEAIHWKPAIAWRIDRIHVLKPIQFQSIRRNEVERKIPLGSVRAARNKGSIESLYAKIEDDRQQRAATVLVNVDYAIEAHFDMTDEAGEGDSEGKHLDVFNRRARNGQSFHQPCLGTREFAADYTLLENADLPPAIEESRDLGWMLYDIDHENERQPLFFRAEMKRGVVDIPSPNSPEVRR